MNPPPTQPTNGSGDLQQINLITNPNSSSNPGGVIGIKVTTINNQNNNQFNVGSINNNTSLNTVYSNKTVQSIVQKYTVECKSKFDELSKIILKLNLCRKELREYDRQFNQLHTN